jgi:hypothetical protein
MHNILRKYSNQQIFQYCKSTKNLKEQRKTQSISWNEKRCAENAKISREIRERNTQHGKNKKKKMQCCAKGKESKGHILVRTADYQFIDRQSRKRPDSRIGLSGRFTLEAENRGKICRKIIFPKVSFRTRMYK